MKCRYCYLPYHECNCPERFEVVCGQCDSRYEVDEFEDTPTCSDCGKIDLCPECAHACDGCESSWLCTDCVNSLHPMGELCPECRKVAA